jgi:hypothetical protein
LTRGRNPPQVQFEYQAVFKLRKQEKHRLGFIEH